MKILISGHNGFIGKHLLRKLKCVELDYEMEFLTRLDFKSPYSLAKKISSNDIIFHFAGVNRDIDEKEVFNKNSEINETLYLALEEVKFKGKLIFTSSTQEDTESLYGKAKKDARLKFDKQSNTLGYFFNGIITPNIFGPFCKPNYNSFIATFSHKILNKEIPKVNKNKSVSLIYIGDFIDLIINAIYNNDPIKINNELIQTFKVKEILNKLNNFNDSYILKGHIPHLESYFDLCLFNTFRSYIEYEKFFPINHQIHIDGRGLFSELTRSFSEGQTSYSVTKKGIIRGNHFHTRKIERFSVVSGKAKISLREVLSEKKIEFFLDGDRPSYVDMPIWYTHNIENIGDEDLITMFWINEHYNEDSPDTYLENV